MCNYSFIKTNCECNVIVINSNTEIVKYTLIKRNTTKLNIVNIALMLITQIIVRP